MTTAAIHSYFDIKVCNCAGCKRLLLGESMQAVPLETLKHYWVGAFPVFLHDRINERPYCVQCYHKIQTIQSTRMKIRRLFS